LWSLGGDKIQAIAPGQLGTFPRHDKDSCGTSQNLFWETEEQHECKWQRRVINQMSAKNLMSYYQAAAWLIGSMPDWLSRETVVCLEL
jgi:hypothetical protein